MLLNITEQEYENTLSIIRDLCKIPAPSGLEDERAKYCLDFFRNLGIEDAYIDESKNYLIRRLNEGFIQELRNEGNEKWATYLAARKALMEKIGRKDVVR